MWLGVGLSTSAKTVILSMNVAQSPGTYSPGPVDASLMGRQVNVRIGCSSVWARAGLALLESKIFSSPSLIPPHKAPQHLSPGRGDVPLFQAASFPSLGLAQGQNFHDMEHVKENLFTGTERNKMKAI